MLHTFKAGTIDPTKCVTCKRAADMHDCDICGAQDVSVQVKFGNMLMCGPCTENEERLYAESQRPENVAARVETQQKAAEINAVLNQAKTIDESVTVKSEIFNAETVSLDEIKAAIEADAAIENKPFALAEQVKARFEHLTNVVFELNNQIVEATNRQKAIQVYLNQLANKLRAEEREKLKISDLSYQPKPVKSATPKPIKTSGAKKNKALDKAELRKYAAELGVAEFTLQSIIVSKGVTVQVAANILREKLAIMKSSLKKEGV
jgi:hypothetical protein